MTQPSIYIWLFLIQMFNNSQNIWLGGNEKSRLSPRYSWLFNGNYFQCIPINLRRFFLALISSDVLGFVHQLSANELINSQQLAYHSWLQVQVWHYGIIRNGYSQKVSPCQKRNSIFLYNDEYSTKLMIDHGYYKPLYS